MKEVNYRTIVHHIVTEKKITLEYLYERVSAGTDCLFTGLPQNYP